MSLFLFVVGIIISIIGALLGIGGGVILVPFLVLVFHIPIHQAVAASLITIIATSSQVAAFGGQHHYTNIRLAIFLNLSTVTGAVLGSLAATQVSGKVLENIFAIILFGIAGLMLPRYQKVPDLFPISHQNYFSATYLDPNKHQKISYQARKILVAFGSIFISGMFSGMIGTSGGIFNVPILNLICRIPIRAAAATSSLMIGFTAMAGAIVYYHANFVRPLLVAPIVLGVMIGSLIGNHLSTRVRNQWLNRLFIIILIFTALKMLLS